MTPRKTMVVPCIVKSELNVSALTSVLSGFISWRRMISASMPPIRKKMNAVLPYRMPIRLWSTVVIQLQIPVFAGAWAAGAWSRTEVAMAASVLLVRAEVRHQRGDLLVGELPGEHHQRPLLDRIGIAEPPPDVLVGVLQQPRPEGPAASDVAQIGPLHLDAPRGRRARHRVAPDAAAGEEERLARLPDRVGREARGPRRGIGRQSGIRGHPAVVDQRGADALVLDPGGELLRRLRDHPEPHPRVLLAAELGALAAEGAGHLGLEPERVVLAGEDVALARELG